MAASLRFAELELDAEAHAARIGEREVELTRTEYQLLELLMLNPRRVLTVRADLRPHLGI